MYVLLDFWRAIDEYALIRSPLRAVEESAPFDKIIQALYDKKAKHKESDSGGSQQNCHEPASFPYYDNRKNIRMVSSFFIAVLFLYKEW